MPVNLCEPFLVLGVRARVTGAATVLATKVELSSPDTEIKIQGPVDGTPAPADPVLSILGVAIDTTGLDDDDFETNDLDGRAVFFGTVLPGNLVQVEGTIGGGNVITWEEVELEDDD